MRKIIITIAVVCSILIIFSGCVSPDKETLQLQHLVEQINSNANDTLPNGVVLDKCEYKVGDSLLTYHIKVNDNRFDKVNADSLKSSIGRELKSSTMKKIACILSRNNIGLRVTTQVPLT